jgi:hypothetical protein
MPRQSPRAEANRPSFLKATNELCEAFGCHFDFWYQEADGWKPVSLRPADTSPSSLVAQPLDPLATILGNDLTKLDRKPLLANWQDGQQLLIIPLGKDEDVDVVATALVSTKEPELLLRLAERVSRELRQGEKLHQLTEENNAFAAQVSEDFEELTFLHQMSEYLEVSDISKDLIQLTGTILPLLLPTVKAEFVAFVAGEQQSNRGEVKIGPLVSSHGAKGHDGALCQILIERHRQDAESQPVVKNRIRGTAYGRGLPGVNAFLLVKVAKDKRHYGWLLALNRAAGYGYEGQASPWPTSDLEFGTAEATLLVTAASVLATQARNIDLFREKEQLLTNVVRTIVSTIEARDPYTCGHSERVASFGRRLAECYGLDKNVADRIYLAGLLHDVGKIGVSDATLRKPSTLTPKEFEEIKRHPDSGWAILQELKQLSHILPGVLYHHEQYDGKGYPDGLIGEEIPVDGRILALADAYDAMTSDRPYRASLSQQVAETILRDGAGTHWDPKLTDIFIGAMSEMIEIRQNYTHRGQVTRRKKSLQPLDRPPQDSTSASS